MRETQILWKQLQLQLFDSEVNVIDNTKYFTALIFNSDKKHIVCDEIYFSFFFLMEKDES